MFPAIRYLKKKIRDLDGNRFFERELVDEFNRHNINCFGEVIKRKNSEPFPFKVLESEATLPPFSKKSTGTERENACSECDRDGHFGVPNESLTLVYEGLSDEILEKDVLSTYECFGLSGLRTPFKDSAFAFPLQIVSQRFVNVLKDYGAKGYSLEPVYIVLQ